MSWKHPQATSLRDHSRGNFKGATYVVREEENGAYEIERKDRGGRIELIEGDSAEKNLREARTRAQVMAKRNSNSNKEALVRIKPTGEVLGFGGKYEQEKRTPTPESDLEELEDIGLRADDPVGQCIRKERKSGRPQDQAVAICLSKRDRGALEDHELDFHDEDASEPNPDIDVNEDVEETLRELVQDHNSEVEKDSRKATIGQLKSVYSRGRGAFTQTSRPGVDSATQWALARVKNAYLPLLKTGEPPNEDYVQDNDLLPEGHPKSTRGEMSDTQVSLEKSLEKDYDEPVTTGQVRDYIRSQIEGDQITPEEKENIIQKVSEKFEMERQKSELAIDGMEEFGEIKIKEDEDAQDMIDTRQKTGTSDREKEKGELEKKAETLEPFVDEQDNLTEFSDTDMSTNDLIKLTNAEDIFNEYQEDTELTVDQLERWLDDPCRKRASGDDHDKHIQRAMFLLQEIDSPEDAVKTEVPDELAMERAERRVPDELEGDVSGNLAVFQMEYASSFISRHKALIDNPDSISTETEECPSISESALRNWAGSHFDNPTI